MRASDAYAILVRELEAARQKPPSDLIALIRSRPIERSVEIAGEQLALETVVAWHDRDQTKIRITAHARGPSTWAHEHFQETLVLSVNQASGA